MRSTELREAFTGYFASRGHLIVPSASLIPHDTSVMFTIAGMVPFKPYFLGEEQPPALRVTSVQKCFRTLDIEVVGTTERHCTFFEMLGNFSFGDYFKPEAISFAWEFVSEVLGIDADRLWVTVHHSDSDAEEIWRDAVGVLPERIQRMGEENFWRMGDVGPCGPCSELYFDRGPEHGAPGGPAHGAPDRFVEIWNLVFMQADSLADGSMAELPTKCIDTGAGLERMLPILDGVDSIFATDVFLPVIAAAEEAVGRHYGRDAASDVSLRILADHARAMTFLISDGVLPSNEGRGYVLRRVVRRLVRTASQLGAGKPVAADLVGSVVATMGSAYPQLVKDSDFIAGVVSREEERFLRTLDTGAGLLANVLSSGEGRVPGDVAFRLHDTYGFPVELTTEIAAENGVAVDMDGFQESMEIQRSMSRKAASVTGDARLAQYREILEQFATTCFVGYEQASIEARVLAVVPCGQGDAWTAEVFIDSTPFYAESGGQVGDTGTIVTGTGVATVVDTVSVLSGLVCHRAVVKGELLAGQSCVASIDAERREAIRRNHTSTHLLHWALRNVLGDHVRQQGSLVAPDRLRFDFSHFEALSAEEIAEVERLVNAEILSDLEVRTTTMSREDAQAQGAIAFFGDKYGDVVRVVSAGSGSVELCGGTHVSSLGTLGSVIVVSEGSIGANTRRLEAVSGWAALSRSRAAIDQLNQVSGMLKVQPENIVDALERIAERQRRLEKDLRSMQQARIAHEAAAIVSDAHRMKPSAAAPTGRAPAASARGTDDPSSITGDAPGDHHGATKTAGGGRAWSRAVHGVSVARRDGFDVDALREIAVTVRDTPGCKGAFLAGTPDGKRVALVAALGDGTGLEASKLVSLAARVVGGGGGGARDLAVAGGKDAGKIDDALDLATREIEHAFDAAGTESQG